MNNFTLENSTKVYFGKGSEKEFLAGSIKEYGNNVMLAYAAVQSKRTVCMMR